MEIVVTSDEMRAVDRFAINKLKIPGLILMENAGRGVVEKMEAHYGSLGTKSVLILCGKGNNGGDGLVVARHLFNRGANVTVALIGKSKDLKPDARSNFKMLKSIGENISGNKMLRILELTSGQKIKILPKTDFIVDALFGTGFSGGVKGIHGQVISWANDRSAKKVSIDIPSGVNSDNGEVENIAFQADLTVSLGLMKTGLICYKGRSYTGKLEVVDIGVSEKITSSKGPKTYRITGNDINAVLPFRPLDAHKHSVGKILVIAGARGFTGAAYMASTSAMRSGAGAVVLAVPTSIYPILSKKLTEVMVEPFEETNEGSLSLNAYKALKERLDWADIVILGPGLSQTPETHQLIHQLIEKTNKPLLVDADGLNALAEKIGILKKRKSKDVILTPHTGEFSRLTDLSSDDIERNRVDAARDFAQKYRVTLVLKGSPTVTASPDGEVFINSTGNPGMATAGSGDVLAGIIGGLWGQQMKPVEAAYAGVFIHGMAGDLASQKFGVKSMMAMDILQSLPASFLAIERTAGSKL